MEFNEKLQQLRKQRNLTQEELAETLYVSRTAVSKWESGRGYPSIDSLKAISRLFSVSIDELLSSEELISLAETESKEKAESFSDMVFGILDCTTMLLLCVMPTAIMQFNRLIKGRTARITTNTVCVIFAAVAVVGRLLSGVHWFTDILGGVLLSSALVMLYYSVNILIESKKTQGNHIL